MSLYKNVTVYSCMRTDIEYNKINIQLGICKQGDTREGEGVGEEESVKKEKAVKPKSENKRNFEKCRDIKFFPLPEK